MPVTVCNKNIIVIIHSRHDSIKTVFKNFNVTEYLQCITIIVTYPQVFAGENVTLLSFLFCQQLLYWNTKTTSWISDSSTAHPIHTGCPTSWMSSPGLCRLLEKKASLPLIPVRLFFKYNCTSFSNTSYLP